MTENKRLTIAMTISMLIIVMWQEFYIKPMVAEMDPGITQEESQDKTLQIAKDPEILPRNEVIEEGFKHATRIHIENSSVKGSINLVGARLDDLVLKKYVKDVGSSENITLLSPSNTDSTYFAEFGWISNEKELELPSSKTIWHADVNILSPKQPVLLTWKSHQGVTYKINIELDDDYMFKITKTIENHAKREISLQSYAILNRVNHKPLENNMIIHEGGIGVFNEALQEVGFDKFNKKHNYETGKGWIGFSDKYWLTAIAYHKPFEGTFSQFQINNAARFQTDTTTPESIIENGHSSSETLLLFAGAKQVDLLDKYKEAYNIPLFDRAVDFGVLYFITKPIFLLLHMFYEYLQNFGIAILLLTVVIKILLLPLAYKSFSGMNKLKALQPKVSELKEMHKDDSAAFQKALIALYRAENANPLSGCMPLLLQAPIFFALYKVLYVTIEMRHAPFFLWIHDLSAPDPTTIFNLFGLLPFDVPQFLMVGAFPILMSVTMHLQQRLNPAPTDPAQAQVMKMMPWVFLFMFASFPVGLVIYWSWSNIISILQQIAIKRYIGHNMSSSKDKAKKKLASK